MPMKPLLLVLALLLAFGSLSVDAGKRHKRDKRAHEDHRTGISIEGGPIVADTHDGAMLRLGSYANPMHFTERYVPVYLYVDDVVFARQQKAFKDLAYRVGRYREVRLPTFLLYQLPWQSCAWVDADRANKPYQSISVCSESELGWSGYVTMWYSKWPDILGRVMMSLDTEAAQTRQGLICHEMMHAVGGVLDDYGADPDGSCIYGYLSYLGPSDVAYLRSEYQGQLIQTQTFAAQIDQSGQINPQKNRRKRR
jgi:hypothetical protein